MISTIITNPEKKDISALKKLWQDIFRDEESYIELFFGVKYKPENTFVIKENNELVSMLFLEVNTITVKGKEYKGAYLCGIATKEEKRGRGYAGMLIDYAISAVCGIDVFYLIPASRELFGYYEKFGFKPFTPLDKTEIKKEAVEEIGDYSTDFSFERLNTLYEKSADGLYVKRSCEDFKAIYDCYKKFMIFDDGYIVYYISDKVLNIIEYTLSFEKANKVGAYIINKYSLDKGFIMKRYGKTPFTAYKSNIDFDEIEKKYINLMLN